MFCCIRSYRCQLHTCLSSSEGSEKHMILLLLKEMEVNCLLFIYCMIVIDIGLSVAHWSGKKINEFSILNWETVHFFVRNKHSLFFNGWHCSSLVVHPFFFRPVSYRSKAHWWRYESFSHLRKILRTSPECRTTGHLNLSSDGAFKSGRESNEIRYANKVVHVY